MSLVFIGLLVWTVLPKIEAQHGTTKGQSPQPFHTDIDQKFNIKRRITNEFDKPSSVRLKSNRGDSFSASIYKCNPVKGSCDLNVYKIFSNDRLSDQLRNDYEVWNSVDPHSNRIQRLSKRNQARARNQETALEQDADPESVARSKARYTKLVDSPENKPFVLDDDYSLVNYIDNWKGLDPDHKIKRFNRKPETLKSKHTKRESEDKEFRVEFHSSKRDNEFRGKLPSSYELVNERRRMSLIHGRKVKSHCRSKHDRNYGCFDPGTNHFKSKTRQYKKKRVLWGRKRAKFYPKLGPKSGFLDELESKGRPNMEAMGHAWHWATTRNYIMAAPTPKKEFVTPHSQRMGMMPHVYMPINLSDSLVRKSFDAKGHHPQMHRTELQRVGDVQKPIQYIPNSNLPIGLSPNRQVALALQPVFNQNRAQKLAPIRLGNPTRGPSIYFNAPTEFINPYENHYEKFKNTPYWNARQGPPGFREVLSNPVRLSNFQRFTISPNIVRNEHFLNPSLSFPSIFDHLRAEPKAKLKNETCSVQKLQVLPVAKEEDTATKQTTKAFETADIVNLIQSALLPQNIKNQAATTTEGYPSATLPNSLPIDKMLDLIAPRSSTAAVSIPITMTTENAAPPATEDPKLIVDATKEALLSLFTTEEPIMENLEDILRRNTDRKIPIVYDIEEAPQLATQKSNDKTDHPSKNESLSQNCSGIDEKHHALHRRGILKKNKTTIKHKSVQKLGSINATLTTPWIILATTQNMLYSELMAMQRKKLNQTKTRKSTSGSKINLLFKNKVKPNETTDKPIETTDETPKSTNEPKAKNKRDQKAVARSRPGNMIYEIAGHI